MHWLANIKMVYKLSLLILIAVFSLVIVGYTGFHYLQEANVSLNTMYEDRLIPVKVLNDGRSNIRALNGAVLELMLTTDTKKNLELKNFIDTRTKLVGDRLAEIEKTNLDDKARTSGTGKCLTPKVSRCSQRSNSTSSGKQKC